MRLSKLFPRYVQFGPPRTGSTLVWNAMRVMLPGHSIPKRHNLNFLLRHACFRSRIVCTVRNPLDAIASSIRRYKLAPSADVLEAQILEFRRNGMDEMPALVERKDVLFLKYEEFYQNFDWLFESLENFLNVRMDTGSRENFKVDFNVERIKQASDKLGSFGNFSPEILIHGDHVSDHFGQPGSHADLIDARGKRRVIEAYAWYFDRFGYDEP